MVVKYGLTVMLNLFQHLTGQTLKQVQGDAAGLFKFLPRNIISSRTAAGAALRRARVS